MCRPYRLNRANTSFHPKAEEHRVEARGAQLEAERKAGRAEDLHAKADDLDPDVDRDATTDRR